MHVEKVDIQKGIAYLANKEELYVKIVNTFLSGAEKKIEDLKVFFEQGDFERLAIEFHGLKSSSATVGATVLPKIAQELEKAGMEGNVEHIKENFKAFIAQYEDTCRALKDAIENL